MIFKVSQLNGIKSGTISLAFRRWGKPNVKKGSTMKTAIGVIKVLAVDPVSNNKISTGDAIRAGYDNAASLLHDLKKTTGTLFKIKVKYLSEDPRLELRERTDLSESELQKMLGQLERLDKTRGPWVLKVMKLIKRYPERRAGDLADIIQMDKFDFKINVRKLKNLGLTVSHEIGYSISPLGDIVMDKLR
ncbi:MAG: hypothetical protein HOP08_19715 [Cyclobacteriaceae bacterium]|nr:hypothetical protein [Cyclobacteriaceae bacterium]